MNSIFVFPRMAYVHIVPVLLIAIEYRSFNGKTKTKRFSKLCSFKKCLEVKMEKRRKKCNPSWTFNVLQAQKRNRKKDVIWFNLIHSNTLKLKTTLIITLVLVYPHVYETNVSFCVAVLVIG